jgi:NADH-quinone oxidoreductase subunit C
MPDILLAARSFRGEETIEIRAADVVPVCRVLRDDPALGFDFLTDLCGVHYPDRDTPYAVVYHLYSFARKTRLRVKAWLGGDATIATVTGIWPGAEWHEREAFDLVGIRFEGHPDLRRILMPDGFDGHPLRKDFPVEG